MSDVYLNKKKEDPGLCVLVYRREKVCVCVHANELGFLGEHRVPVGMINENKKKTIYITKCESTRK